jgi:hypothetical protein
MREQVQGFGAEIKTGCEVTELKKSQNGDISVRSSACGYSSIETVKSA